MALQTAIDFIERVRRDPAFRRRAYAADGHGGFVTWRKEAGYDFADHEIWDAFRALQLRCPDETAAGEVHELRGWYMHLSGATESEDRCGGCAGRSGCSGSCP